MRRTRSLPLPGARFGRLMIIQEETEKRLSGTKFRRMVRAVCDCGVTTIARYDQLLGGKVRSCGCIQREGVVARNKRLADANRLTAISAGLTKYNGGRCRKCGGTERWSADRQCVACKLDKIRASSREPSRRHRYKVKITNEQYNDMMIAQDSKCANPGCRKQLDANAAKKNDVPHLDHCHETQQIRGFLCGLCNLALGMVDDNEIKLAGLIEYLRRYKRSAA